MIQQEAVSNTSNVATSGTQAKVWISEITFSDASKIPISKNEIVVFVGPNNSGKSASLKEAASLLQRKNENGKVIKDIVISSQGTENDLIAFLDAFSRKQTSGIHPT